MASAQRIYVELDASLAGAESETRLRALIRNDLAALAAMEGRFDEARAGWQAALEIDPDCLMARLNRDLIEAELSFQQANGELGELKLRRPPRLPPLWGKVARRAGWGAEAASVSPIFNLPSVGRADPPALGLLSEGERRTIAAAHACGARS